MTRNFVLCNFLNRSEYSVDVYRPVVGKAVMPGFTSMQWVETHSQDPVLTGVSVHMSGQPTEQELMMIGNIIGRPMKITFLDDDIREQDIVLVHGPAGSVYDEKYFLVHQIQREDSIEAWNVVQSAVCTQIQTGLGLGR